MSITDKFLDIMRLNMDEDEYDDREWELRGGELEQDEEGNWGYHGDL